MFSTEDIRLPPNEIFGRDLPIGIATIAFHLAALIGVLPIIAVLVILLRRDYRLAFTPNGR